MSAVLSFPVRGSDRARYDQALRRQNPDFASSGDYPALRDPAVNGRSALNIGAGGERILNQHFAPAVIYERQSAQIEYDREKDDPIVHPKMVGRGANWGISRTMGFDR